MDLDRAFDFDDTLTDADLEAGTDELTKGLVFGPSEALLEDFRADVRLASSNETIFAFARVADCVAFLGEVPKALLIGWSFSAAFVPCSWFVSN